MKFIAHFPEAWEAFQWYNTVLETFNGYKYMKLKIFFVFTYKKLSTLVSV